MKVVRKSVCTIVLLTITAVTGATGISDVSLAPPLCKGQGRKRQGIRVICTQLFFGKEKSGRRDLKLLKELLDGKPTTCKSKHFYLQIDLFSLSVVKQWCVELGLFNALMKTGNDFVGV